jgi:hypothetical protein
MNTDQLEKLNDLAFKIRQNNLAYLKTDKKERIDNLFINEVRRIANEILNIVDDLEARK